jgi:hypothetical protein
MIRTIAAVALSAILLHTQPVTAEHTSGSPFQFQVPVNSTQTTVVQVSSDLKNWSNLQTNPPGSSTLVVDQESLRFSQRFYRVIALPPESAALPDLGASRNEVFIPGEGFDAVQFAPSGKLGFIAWRGRDLVLRERAVDGKWTEQVVSSAGLPYTLRSADDFRFQPLAALLYDSASRPHVVRYISGTQIAIRSLQANGQWSEQILSPPNSGSSFVLMSAAMGPNDKLHVAVASSGSAPIVSYGSNRSGSWQWARVTTLGGNARGFLPQAYAPRFFSMAVDSANVAHLTYSEFRMPTGPGGYPQPWSELRYASNRSGQWQTQRVIAPSTAAADAGAGASIAIGPDGQPAIASWFNKRADTGSAQESWLMYHRRDGNGNWTSTSLSKLPENYVAGDGPKGTGFAPYLRFDSRGRANILFSDHAAQHFWQSGQNEYAGQIRLAVLDGGSWKFRTLFSQRNPLEVQMVYPAFALSGNEIVFVGLQRFTQWPPDSWPRGTPVSSYEFVFRSVPGN